MTEATDSISLRDRIEGWYQQISNDLRWQLASERDLRQFDTFGQAWYSQLARIVLNGKPSSPRDLATIEICGEAFLVKNLRSSLLVHPIRNLNAKFALAEFLWIASGSDNLEEVAKFNSQLRQFSDDGAHLAGAYGPRLLMQWKWLFKTLQKPDTRQAVATIWTPTPGPSKDIPCTVACQWLIRDNKLNAIITMRSSDIILGLPYDFYCFSQLTNWLSAHLEIETGWLQYQLGSSHLYGDKLEMALKILETPDLLETIEWPQLRWPALSPAGAHRILTDQSLPEHLADQTFLISGDYQIFRDVLNMPNKEQALKWIRHILNQ